MHDCPRCYQKNGLSLRYDLWTCHACGYNKDAEVAVPEPRSTVGFFRPSKPRRENHCECGRAITLGSLRCGPCSGVGRVGPKPTRHCPDCDYRWRLGPNTVDRRQCYRCGRFNVEVIGEKAEVTA